MTDVDTGGGDRLALAVLTQHRMATTEQMHRVIAPGVHSEQPLWPEHRAVFRPQVYAKRVHSGSLGCPGPSHTRA